MVRTPVFCPGCSRRLPSGVGHCSCGTAAAPATPPVDPAPAPAPRVPAPVVDTARRTALRRIGASAVVLTLGIAVILLDRDDGGSTSVAVPTARVPTADPRTGADLRPSPDTGSGPTADAIADPGADPGSRSPVADRTATERAPSSRAGGPSPVDRDDPAPAPSPGDLGLSTPISSPPCTGGFAVFVGAAVNPSNYRQDVRRILTAHPGAEYLLTAASCSSLARTSGGNDIYAVYHGPFDTLRDACAQQRRSGGDSYVRRLDHVTPVGQTVSC
jgi:serine/threonine-protein kinase